MNIDQFVTLQTGSYGLQTTQVRCKLQTICKLESNKNRGLRKFAVCRAKFAETSCKLSTNPVNSRGSGEFLVCTQTPSLYERGETPEGETLPLGKKAFLERVGYGVLCLDLGTTTGWAVHSKQGVITSGSVSFKNDRWQGGGMRFLKFAQFLNELNQSAGPIRRVFFEEVRRHLGVDAAHAYGGFMAHLTAWCEQHKIAYEAVPVGTIKRHATGKGNASKAMMMDAARNRGHRPVDDNEADALALLHWAIDHCLGGR